MMTTTISRHRCVMCGKLRKDEYLCRIQENWICNFSITSSGYTSMLFQGQYFQIHKCKIEYSKSLFIDAKTAIDKYNNAINDKKLIWFLDSKAPKKDIPEPTFFLQ